ncbi:MAG: hypothetical protein DSM106950_26885 [Stigonema ocellatum SAG 48.90 = DSM 106950]|nr:hypothetical protein [Stigonema ocellatum SAG 48.90 = DSM 106950]
MGIGEWGVGSGEWGVGIGEWGVGSGDWGLGNGEWGMGNGEWGMGNRIILIPKIWQQIQTRKQVMKPEFINYELRITNYELVLHPNPQSLVPMPLIPREWGSRVPQSRVPFTD